MTKIMTSFRPLQPPPHPTPFPPHPKSFKHCVDVDYNTFIYLQTITDEWSKYLSMNKTRYLQAIYYFRATKWMLSRWWSETAPHTDCITARSVWGHTYCRNNLSVVQESISPALTVRLQYLKDVWLCKETADHVRCISCSTHYRPVLCAEFLQAERTEYQLAITGHRTNRLRPLDRN